MAEGLESEAVITIHGHSDRIGAVHHPCDPGTLMLVRPVFGQIQRQRAEATSPRVSMKAETAGR